MLETLGVAYECFGNWRTPMNPQARRASSRVITYLKQTGKGVLCFGYGT